MNKMVNIAIDIETQGLNAKNFIMGSIVKDNTKKPIVFYDKVEMWNYIIKLGIETAKRKKTLNVYAHNIKFDSAGIFNFSDNHLKIISNNPFIWSYELNDDECIKNNIKPSVESEKKEIIKFLDTYSIFPMNLKELGDMIDYPKLEIPEKLIKNNNEKYNSKELKEMEIYNINDSMICLKSIEFIKNILKNEDIHIKRLYTISQIAMGYIENKYNKLDKKYKTNILENEKKMIYYKCKNPELIHKAYRGGRVEAFKTGIFKNIDYKDFNSLYPWSAINIKLPKLNTEQKYLDPLNTGFELEEIINKIGVSRVLMYNENNKLGILPIRTQTNNYYPKSNKYIIGTYTNMEIKFAIENGYKLIAMEWTILFDTNKYNFLKPIFTETYKKRMETTNKFNNRFYKSVMNMSIGKFAQNKINQEIIIDDVNKLDEYIEKNYKVINNIDMSYLYQATEIIKKKKKYYCPIIPALINANARIIMYKEMNKYDINDLLYTDTDSIMIINKNNKYKSNKDSKEIGKFKTIEKQGISEVIGRKTYKFNDEIKISGISKNYINSESWKNRKIYYKNMNYIYSTTDIEKVGTFENKERDLLDQQQKYIESNKKLEELKIYIDNDITNINFFINYLIDVI